MHSELRLRAGRAATGKVVLFEGDGGLFFHIQELETLKRQGYRILICAMNDGGYGSEFHKLRADGLDDSLAVFGRPALEKIARGFDLRGHEIAMCRSSRSCSPTSPRRAKAKCGTSKSPTRSRRL
jgi:thiamine pyrophosphate-dependent acetolactate synthase large subunit-like protein